MVILYTISGIFKKVKIGHFCPIFPVFLIFEPKTAKKRLFDQFSILSGMMPMHLF